MWSLEFEYEQKAQKFEERQLESLKYESAVRLLGTFRPWFCRVCFLVSFTGIPKQSFCGLLGGVDVHEPCPRRFVAAFLGSYKFPNA